MRNRTQQAPQSEIYITDFDMACLRSLVTRMLTITSDDELLKRLEDILGSAHVVETQKIDADVVTLDSEVKLVNLESGSVYIYTLGLPSQADIKQGKVSVFAPIGMAMLGRKRGDEFSVEAPRGVRRFRVEEVLYQPEKAEAPVEAALRRSGRSRAS